jgi:hypothetical protein
MPKFTTQKKAITIDKPRNKGGRPKGSVTNKAIKEAMKRKFGRVITPQKFGKLVQLIYDQAMGVEETEFGERVKKEPCKASQRLIFDYAMIKPGQEVESASKDHSIQIIISDMPTRTQIEGEIEDAVYEEEETKQA